MVSLVTNGWLTLQRGDHIYAYVRLSAITSISKELHEDTIIVADGIKYPISDFSADDVHCILFGDRLTKLIKFGAVETNEE